MHGIVDAVLRFVYEQEAVAAIGKGKSKSEKAHRAVAKTLKRNRTIVIHELDDRPPLLIVSHHRHTFHRIAEDQPQSIHRVGFILGQGNAVPECRYLLVPHEARTQQDTFHCRRWFVLCIEEPHTVRKEGFRLADSALVQEEQTRIYMLPISEYGFEDAKIDIFQNFRRKSFQFVHVLFDGIRHFYSETIPIFILCRTYLDARVL